MIIGLDHIAIAVADFEAAIQRFLEDFGLTHAGNEDVHSAQTKTAFFPITGTKIELIHPLDGAGPVQKHLEKRGVKHSGYGREGSKYGLEDYLDTQYICEQF